MNIEINKLHANIIILYANVKKSHVKKITLHVYISNISRRSA